MGKSPTKGTTSKSGTDGAANPLLSAPRERTLILYPTDVEDQLQQLDKAIEKAYEQEAGTRRATGRSPATKLAEERDAIRAAADENAVRLRLRALNAAALQQLLGKHAPRKGNPLDAAVGYNSDTFRPALIQACLIEPAVTPEQFDEWVDQAHAGRLRHVFQSAWDLCYDEVELPFGSAVSALTRLRARGQRRPDATE